MIHEEICTYEVCKLAKEKGVDVQTFDWYDYTGNYHKGFIPHELHECPRYKEYYAPTQSLLQRWLREEKGIHISVEYEWVEGIDDWTFWAYIKKINNAKVVNDAIKSGFNTYEFALEDALKYALENLV